MPKAQNIQATRKRHKRTLHAARGYFGNRSRLYKHAKEALYRAGQNAYRDRRRKKREMVNLWVVRINATVRAEGMTYSRFMERVRKLGVKLDRKQLSELAINDLPAFQALVAQAKALKA
jgi:large subunit ribosomal protein L20